MNSKNKKGIYEKYIKRLFDIICSGLALIILSPLLIVVCLLVRCNLGSPIIFKQERPGYHGEIFEMYKFRTMLSAQTRDGRILTDSERLECIEKGIDILSDEERLTKFGRFLRMLSIDELPELWNILKGDMSIVGPRPLAVIYLPYYTEEENRRHDARPGLTGLAQVMGRNSASWETKFKYDIEYVDNITFLNDLKIIFKTVSVVLSRDGIGQGEEKPESFCDVRQREWDEQKNEENSLVH